MIDFKYLETNKKELLKKRMQLVVFRFLEFIIREHIIPTFII